jgi:hypothetical protein
MNEEIKKIEDAIQTLSISGKIPVEQVRFVFNFAWELAHQTTEDDERDADAYTAERLQFISSFSERQLWEPTYRSTFLAGRRGLREAVQTAVKEERERIRGLVQEWSLTGDEDELQWLLKDILNPKDGA